MVVPVDSAKNLAAVASKDHLGEAVVACETPLGAVFTGMCHTPVHKLLLYYHEDVFRNNYFIVFTILFVLFKAQTRFEKACCVSSPLCL